MDVSWTGIGLLSLAAFAAGAIDAVAGGGGLISLPALLACGLPPHLALGTNKGQSVFGSGAALLRYARAGVVDGRRARLAFPLGFAGAVLGAWLALAIRPQVLRPVVLALLLVAGAVVALRPSLTPAPAAEGADPGRSWARIGAIAALVGAYDGFFGPGAGTFLILAYVSWLHLAAVPATADAKVVNFASNLASVLTFAVQDRILWSLALPMAAAQFAGASLGAHLTLRRGERLVRAAVLAVVAALVVKLAWDMFGAGR